LASTLYKDFAIKVKDQRTAQGLTCTEFAKKAGISPSHYRKIERAEVRFGITMLRKIVEGLGVRSEHVLQF
jgi:transcriptional regulator with XRE-family HTH domain